MEKNINIEEVFEFNDNDVLVVGCSTGPDSMALLDMILKVREKYHLKIVCAHVNHNLREQSIKEAEFIKNYCCDNNIYFEYMTIEEYGDDNFHNEARNIRYNFFEDIVLKYNAEYLMTAHHGDDLMETILMRLTRGSNLKGYSGFKRVVDMNDYKIVRPLIYFTKDELTKYNEDNGVPYFIDESNEKDTYTRNRYRKVILPFLKEEDKNAHLKFLKFSEDLIEASKYIDIEREKAIDIVIVDNKLLIDKFLELNKYLQKEILYYMLHEYYQDDLILVGDKHINLLNNLITSNGSKANVQVNLPNEVIALRSYNTLELKKETDDVVGYEIELSKYVSLSNGHSLELIEDTSENSNNICRLNSNEIELPLIVRTRKFGDKMNVKGMHGSKKIKDIFIDKKIPLSERDKWPVVVDSKDKVIFIPGVKKSKFDKKKTDEYDIIIKYC